MSALAEVRRIVMEELAEGRQLGRDDHGIASQIADRIAEWAPDPTRNVCPACSEAAA